MKKIKSKMTKPIYLGMSILDICKILMYEFWYNHIKPKDQSNAKVCYIDTDTFINHIKTEDFCKDIALMLKNGFTHQTIVNMIIDHFQEA